MRYFFVGVEKGRLLAGFSFVAVGMLRSGHHVCLKQPPATAPWLAAAPGKASGWGGGGAMAHGGVNATCWPSIRH